MQFSERIGAVRRTIQLESMNEKLRNRLWNVIYRTYWSHSGVHQHARSVTEGQLLIRIATNFFGFPEDDMDLLIVHALGRIKKWALRLDWAHFYDFVEFVVNDSATPVRRTGQASLCLALNEVLKEELSGYRFVGTQLAPITNNEEITAVESVISLSGVMTRISTHMSTALARLADRPQPDSRNSMKESISGVEAACQFITGDRKAKIGDALQKLDIHPALRNGFNAIYGYTSNADGIRHALSEDSTVNADDARFFLVSCSAFINYLLAKFSEGPRPA